MRIVDFKSVYSYKYLWLKYVTGFNLDVHCARCLLGNYSKKVGVYSLYNGAMHNIELDEYPYRYIYLCGVTIPYRWENNLHLALEYCEGGYVVFDECGVHVEVENAKRIEIKTRPYYAHPKGHLREYNTCRNWRFAYQQIAELSERS